MLQAEAAQIRGFGLSHYLLGRRRRVLVADEMQATVDDVEEQFVVGGPVVLWRLASGVVGTGNDLSFQGLFGRVVFEEEGENVGGIVVLEVLAVQLMDFFVGDNG